MRQPVSDVAGMMRWLLVLMLLSPVVAGGDVPLRLAEPELAAMVETDWSAQESRSGRAFHDPAAISAVIERGSRVMEFLASPLQSVDVGGQAVALKRLARRAEALDSLDKAARTDLYLRLRWTVREAIMKNPQVAGQPIVFLQRRRFLCQMLHEYMGYYHDYGELDGGGVYRLEAPGRSLAVRDLINGRLPRGNYTTLSLCYNARRLHKFWGQVLT